MCICNWDVKAYVYRQMIAIIMITVKIERIESLFAPNGYILIHLMRQTMVLHSGMVCNKGGRGDSRCHLEFVCFRLERSYVIGAI